MWRWFVLLIALAAASDAPAQFSSTGVGIVLPKAGGGGGGCTNGSTDLSTTCGVLTFTAIGVL